MVGKAAGNQCGKELKKSLMKHIHQTFFIRKSYKKKMLINDGSIA